ncbi:DUF2254 domain-containing protein [Clostridiales bacterium COT073_COT-073]|nr:DUF2254 domain-containing protein [Clostridiales bacterium COT073_COT-073]
MQKLKIFYYNYITWIYTLQYIFFSMILLLVVSLIDLRIIPLHQYLPDVIKLKVDFSQSILITLSAAFLTITTFTFSTILTVLNTYASSFTPRVVENFINMKITLKVLGIFIGGFFYCVACLVFTRDFFENEFIIAGFVAILYSVLCIMYFVVFIQQVITQFQGVNVILDIANKAQTVIDSELERRKESTSFAVKENFASIPIRSGNSGYFSSIDLDSITSLLATGEGYLRIDSKIGEYVAENTTIATLYLQDGVDEEISEKVLNYFIFQDKKMETTDYRYNITKLLEIALRAISPGINDPNTAIHCINKLGVLLSTFAQIDNYHIQKAENNKFRIYYSSYSFQEDLATFYLPLIHYGKEDLQVIIAILNSLMVLFNNATANNKGHILEVVNHLKVKVEKTIETELEAKIFDRHISFFFE